MRLIGLAVVLALSLALAPLAAEGQQAGKQPRVGVLSTGSSTEIAEVQREPFERGLRELGWTPGSNIIVEYRYGEGSVERLTTAAVELARRGVDVFVARGNPAIRAAERASDTIPIVSSSATTAYYYPRLRPINAWRSASPRWRLS
jgi:ABC-type uncharacterized transport system substrate-binding protein